MLLQEINAPVKRIGIEVLNVSKRNVRLKTAKIREVDIDMPVEHSLLPQVLQL